MNNNIQTKQETITNKLYKEDLATVIKTFKSIFSVPLTSDGNNFLKNLYIILSPYSFPTVPDFSFNSANADTIPAKFCRLLGIIIFVAFPSATFSNVSIPFNAITS